MSSLAAVLAGRAILGPYSGPDVQELTNDAVKLIAHSQDFSSLVTGWSKWEAGEVEPLMEYVEGQLLIKAGLAGYSLQEVLESLMIQHAKNHIEAKDSQGLTNLSKLCVRLGTKGVIDLEDIGKHLAASLPVPQLSWILHKEGVISVAGQLDLVAATPGRDLKLFLHELGVLCMGRTEAGVGVMEALVGVAFAEGGNRKAKLARLILEKVLGKMLSWIYEDKDVDGGWLCCEGVPREMAKRWGLHALGILLKFCPNVKISQVVRMQAEWKVELGAGLGSVCGGLVQAVGTEEAEQLVGIVMRVIAREEVNWRAVLGLVSVLLMLVPGADKLLHAKVKELVSNGLEEEDVESLYCGLLMARQAASQNTPCFPSYQAWFSATFGDETTSLASIRKAHPFLMKHLEELVPWDPAQVLRVHLARPPWVPRHMKQMVDDYKQLVRTTLLQRDDWVEPDSVVAPPTAALLAQVTEYVDEWAASGKVPTSVNEASMFRKPYFNGQLLPALLSASLQGEQGKARHNLVEHLQRKGKIPAGLYKSYISGDINKKVEELAEVSLLAEEECGVETLAAQLEDLCRIEVEDDAHGIIARIRGNVRGIMKGTNCDGAFSTELISRPVTEISNDRARSIHRMLLSTWYKIYPKSPTWSNKFINVILSQPDLLHLTYHHLLTDSQNQSDVHGDALLLEATIQLSSPLIELKDSGLGEEKSASLSDILLSVHHSVQLYSHLSLLVNRLFIIEKLPSSVPGRWSLLLHHVSNRSQLSNDLNSPLLSRVWSKDYIKCVEDLKSILELEICLDPTQDSLSAPNKLNFMQQIVLSSGLSHPEIVLATMKVSVEAFSIQSKLPAGVSLAVMAAGRVVTDATVWMDAWVNIMEEIEGKSKENLQLLCERMAEVVCLLPHQVLSCIDVKKLSQLLEMSRNESKLALSLAASSLLSAAISGTKGKISLSKLERLSLFYWSICNQLSLPSSLRSLSSDPSLVGLSQWQHTLRTGSDPESVDKELCSQAGLLHLAELHCQGLQMDHPLVDRVISLLDPLPILKLPVSNWFSGTVPERLASATLYVLLVAASKHKRTAKLLISTLLPAHKSLLDNLDSAGLNCVSAGHVTKEVTAALANCDTKDLQAAIDDARGVPDMHPEVRSILRQFVDF